MFHVRRAKRNRIDPRRGEIERLAGGAGAVPLAGGLGGGLGRHGAQPAARPFGRVAAAPFVCMAEGCNAIVPPGQGARCPMHRGGPAPAFGAFRRAPPDFGANPFAAAEELAAPGGFGGGPAQGGFFGARPAFGANPFAAAADPFVCMAEGCNTVVPPGRGMHCPTHRGGPAQAFGGFV